MQSQSGPVVIVIAGHLVVGEEQRDAYVAAHADLISGARASDGCPHLAINADVVDARRVDVVEVWRDANALENRRGRADGPTTPETVDKDVRRYDAVDGGPLFKLPPR